MPTVADGIQMATLADTEQTASCGDATSTSSVASFAPDGKAFVIVLRRGDIARDLNRYTMLLWRTTDLGSGPPHVVIEMQSSSARPAIDPASIVWAPGDQTLTFLGENPHDRHEVFRLNLKSGQVVRVTNHPTSVMSYSVDASGAAIAYEALPRSGSVWDAETARYGLPVSTQSVLDLLTGEKYSNTRRIALRELFIQNLSGRRAIRPLTGSIFRGSYSVRDDQQVSISPDGRYVIVLESVPITQVPQEWRRYPESVVQQLFSVMGKVRGFVSNNDSLFSRYVLVDSRTGQSRPLLDVPVIRPQPVIWAPDSASAVISQTLLPIVGGRGKDTEGRRGNLLTVQVDVHTGVTSQIGNRCFRAIAWEKSGLICTAAPDGMQLWLERPATHGRMADWVFAEQSGCHPLKLSRYHYSQGKWLATTRPKQTAITVSIKQGMNSPPVLYYNAGDGSQSHVLLRLDPQLNKLRLGHEKQVTWTWGNGHQVTAGLYYPAQYAAGRRYPLVIQTHAFVPDQFEFFGPFPTADAAQPLAAHGMFVLQVDDMRVPVQYGKRGQLTEVETAMEIYKSGIAYLSRAGLVDPRRVGIVGFSHTCFYVKWALAHEPALFAAASVEEGEDGGYVQYITGLNDYVDAESLYGGPPFGNYLHVWTGLSPSFSLDHVRAPLLITVTHNKLILLDWEWFEGLRDLGKPVYMVVLDGRASDLHELQKPWDRIVSSGGVVDWFDFWLNGHENRTPGKVAQYLRWEHLRALSRAHPEQARAIWRVAG